jgi:hypothetical protein
MKPKSESRSTVAFKDGSRAVYLKHLGTGPVLNFAVGEIPGGAVFKTNSRTAESMLTSDMFRTATPDEIEETFPGESPKSAEAASGSSGAKKKTTRRK